MARSQTAWCNPQAEDDYSINNKKVPITELDKWLPDIRESNAYQLGGTWEAMLCFDSKDQPLGYLSFQPHEAKVRLGFFDKERGAIRPSPHKHLFTRLDMITDFAGFPRGRPTSHTNSVIHPRFVSDSGGVNVGKNRARLKINLVCVIDR